jgi:protein TonB
LLPVAVPRLRVYVDACGLRFFVTTDAIDRLRRAGADDQRLAVVRRGRLVLSLPIPVALVDLSARAVGPVSSFLPPPPPVKQPPPPPVNSTPVNPTPVNPTPVNPTPPPPVPVPDRIVLPRKTFDVPPVYPPAAALALVEGEVTIHLTVARDGLVKDPKIVRGVPSLNNAALAAVRQWRYTPALRNDVPV